MRDGVRRGLIKLLLLGVWLGLATAASAQTKTRPLPPEPPMTALEARLARLPDRAAMCAAVATSRWSPTPFDPGWFADSADRRFWSDGYLAHAVRLACESGELEVTGFGPQTDVCGAHRYGNVRFLAAVIPRLGLRALTLGCLTSHPFLSKGVEVDGRQVQYEQTHTLKLAGFKLETLAFFRMRDLQVSIEDMELREISLLGNEQLALHMVRSHVTALDLGRAIEGTVDIAQSQIGRISASFSDGVSLSLRASKLTALFGGVSSRFEALALSQVDVAEDIRLPRVMVAGPLSLERVRIGGDLDLSDATLGMPAPGQVPSARLETDNKARLARSCGWARLVEARASWASVVSTREPIFNADGDEIGHEGGNPDAHFESSRALSAVELQIKGVLRLPRAEVRGQTSIVNSSFGALDAMASCWLGPTELSNSSILSNAFLNNAAIQPMSGEFAEGGLINFHGLKIGGFLEMPEFSAGARTNFYRLSVGSHLYAGSTVWRGGLLMNDAEFGRDVDLANAHLPPAYADDRDANLDCSRNLLAICDLSARHLLLRDATVQGRLTARNARVRGHVSLVRAHLDGAADFRNAQIDGHFDFASARRLSHLQLSNSRIGMELFGSNVPLWRGDLQLHAATIGQGVLLDNITLWQGRLWAEDVRIPSLVRLRNVQFAPPQSCQDEATPCRNIHLAYGQIDGALDLQRIRTEAPVRIVSMKIGGDINLAGAMIGESFDVSQSSLATLRTQNETCRAPAPGAEGAAASQGTADGNLGLFGRGALVLGGTKMLYPALSLMAIRPYDPATKARDTGRYAPVRLGGAEYALRADLGCPDDILKQKGEVLAHWISDTNVTPDGLDPQPYEQLAKALNETGRRKDADDVLKAKFERREQATALWSKDGLLLSAVGIAVGYGLETERAFLWWGLLVLVGTLVRLGLHKVLWNIVARVALRLNRPRYRLNLLHRETGRLRLLNHAFWFSFCHAIPVVPDLYPPKRPFMERVDDIPPSIGPSEAYGYFILHKIVAAALLAIAAASAAGLIK